MAGIIGSPLTQGVSNQIAARQRIHKKDWERTNNDITYLTSKTAWVKLSSSVNTLTAEEVNLLIARNGRGNIKGDSTLAAINVLSGGLLGVNGALREGIDLEKIYGIPGQEYDLGSLTGAYSNRKSTAGIKPMPGITGMTVQSKNTYGTLREAEVKFVCWTLEDFEFMEKLYLRPGFSILLEWGHSLYIDNEGQLETVVQTVSEEFFRSGITMQEILNEIRSIRTKSNYNYEGMIGYVKNFSWNYTKSGAYECTVSIISTGEILESIGLTFHPYQRIPANQIDKDNYLEQKTMYHYFYEKLKTHFKLRTFYDKESLKRPMVDYIDALEDFRTYYTMITTDQGLFGNRENIDTYWVPIRVIFDIFNKLISWIDISKTLGSEDYTYLKFNTDYAKSSKYITSPEHFSVDPSVCVLPWETTIEVTDTDWMAQLESAIKVAVGTLTRTYPTTLSTEEYNFRVNVVHDNVKLPENSDPEDVLNILVSLPYVVKKVDEALDKDGKRTKSVHDIFMSILDGVETALGGINDFDFVYEDDTNTYYLVDRNVTPTNADDHPTLTLAGFDSIFTDVGLSSKISNEMGSQISIAAQASTLNYVNNVGNLIKWHPSIMDRIRVTKDTSNKQPSPDGKQQLDKLESIQDWLEDVQDLYEYINKETFISDGYSDDELQAAKTMHAEWTVENVVQKNAAAKKEPIPGLIPVELSFTLDGIGGFIIGQAFKIAPGLLPAHYQDKFGFIVNGIEHSIDAKNRWETTVKALFYVLEKEQGFVGGAKAAPTKSANQNNANRPPISKKAGGNFRTIEGTTYKNGEVPDNKLRYINNWKSYKGKIASDGGRIRLYDTASRALDRLLTDAAAAGIKFKINGAYRTYDDQVTVKNQKVAQGKGDEAATPGTSPHGFGLAVDFANAQNEQLRPNFSEYQWLKKNAEKYGFRRLGWPANKGEQWEAWHWEYQNS